MRTLTVLLLFTMTMEAPGQTPGMVLIKQEDQKVEVEGEKCDLCQEEKEAHKSPRTLFQWAVKQNDDEEEEDEEEDTIVTDRPDFTEASSTVGQGRVQFELGYTFFADDEMGTRIRRHSYPEALVRIGILEWLELRVVQNYLNERTSMTGMSMNSDGFEDMMLGAKIGLTEQEGCLPELAVILQTTVPTGSTSQSNDEMLPGVNLLYGWEALDGYLELGGSTQINRARDDVGHFYYEIAQSATLGVALSKKLSAYTEYFGFYPTSARVGPLAQHFINGGFRYLITNNVQFDIRGGLGLNRNAEDYFVGSGISIRY